MTNKEIAGVLKETSSLIELTGGNPFRSRAMANAGRTIQRLEDSVADLLEEGTLTDVRGIGSGLQDQLGQLLRTGSFDVREELLNSVPPGLLDMLAVKGLGAKKVRTLWKTMGIQTLDELESAAAAGQIAELEGFGAKSEASILESVEALRRYRKRRHFADACSRAEKLSERLLELPGVRRVEFIGELRRRLETVAEIGLIVGVDSDEAEEPLHERFGAGSGSIADGRLVLEDTLQDGFPVRVLVVPVERFGTELFEATGSESFVSAWQERFGSPPPESEESDVFKAADATPVPPELREEPIIIDRAVAGDLPALIADSDLRGTLHNHSTYSDGAHSLREMAEAARGMGLTYFGICDHSRSLRIASGLSIEEVQRQQEEIADLNEEFAADDGDEFRIFSGTESDILSDGSLDYPDDVLATFDFVVASVHVGFNMTEAEATDRVVRAVENPYTRILGHPTGRLLLRREGYPLDHEAVLDACAEHGVAVELNANPYRLDLDWRWIGAATGRGILISINPDAHAVDQLAYTRWGVAVARKGGLTPADCLNTMSVERFSDWIQSGKR